MFSTTYTVRVIRVRIRIIRLKVTAMSPPIE